MNELRVCQNQAEWDSFVLDNDGHPLQLWGWGENKALHGWKVTRLILDESDKPIAGAQVLVKPLPWPFKSLAYVPRGPIVKSHQDEFLEALKSYIESKFHPVAIKIEPNEVEYSLDPPWQESSTAILPAETITLDLSQDLDELLSNMSKKTRQYIRKSAKDIDGIKRLKNLEQLESILDIYTETSKRAKFPLHDRQYYRDIYQQMGECNQIYVAHHENKPVAFLWLALSGSDAFELYGGMNETGQSKRANYALKWQAISDCKEWGLNRYDFGGLIEGGVKTFKLGWTNEPTTLAGSFDIPLSGSYIIWDKVLPIVKNILKFFKKLKIR